MILKKVDLEGVKQTGRAMHKMAKEYAFDMLPYSSMSFLEVFKFLADIPFRPDPPGHELIQRPLYTIKYGGDCDDKAIAAASYFINLGIPYRFVAIGMGGRDPEIKKIRLTHVYLEYNISSKWVSFDVTYSFNTLGRQVPFTRMEII